VNVADIMSSAGAWTGEYAWVVQVFGIVVVTLIAGVIVRRFVLHLIERAKASRGRLDDALATALLGPARGLVWVIGLSFAAHVAGQQTDAAIFDAVPVVRDISVVGMLTLFLLRLAKGYEEFYLVQQQESGEPVDRTFVEAAGKLTRASIGITAALVVLQTVGISIAGLLAFGGMGGIAVGLAAQDLLANVFGGVTIYLDRPFSVGDWIRSPDQNVEGTVEQIGWRRTLIRTFDQRPLYVPNAVFTKISVENPSRMTNRRIHETIGVRYSDVDRVPGILAEIRKYLASHPQIDPSRTTMVNFNAFGASSLDFFIYCFTRTIVWTEYHAVKEEVLLHISGIIARQGAEIAFPTRTLHLAQEWQAAGPSIQDPARTAAATENIGHP
jgi:MscS family membrane protein